MVEEAVVSRLKRSMLYATFYAKYHDIEDVAPTTPTIMVAEKPFQLDSIGDGYDVWTRNETQLLILAVILVILTLIFAAIVSMGCSRNAPIPSLTTHRDIVWFSARNQQRIEQRMARSTDSNSEDLKAPPLSYLAPPPYVAHRQDTSLPV